MTKARDLADLISAGNPLADGAISVSEVSGAAPTASPSFTGNVSIGGNATEKLNVYGGNVRLDTGASTTRRIYALGGSGPYTLNSSGGSAIVFDRDASNNDEIAFETHVQGVAHAERMRIGNYGQLGFNGANYGTAGQVLKSNGSGAAPSWGEGGASTGKAIAMAIVFG
jgi:hypothetical protein